MLRRACVIFLVLCLTGCQAWTYVRFDSANTGFVAGDTSLTAAGINAMKPLFTASLGAGNGGYSTPAVVNKKVYVASNTALSVFDANGTTNCSGSPVTCQPLWTAPFLAGSSLGPTVSGGRVYVVVARSGTSTMEVFDANGTTNCAGSPKVCQPLWTANDVVGPSPVIVGNVVYALGLGYTIQAFDAAGSTNCSGAPVVCQPLWRTSALIGVTLPSAPAVDGGMLYMVDTSGSISVFDAAGSTNCSGAPKVCQPLWTTPGYTNGTEAVPPPVVTGGRVFVLAPMASGAGLVAYDAAGSTNCSGAPKVCQPLWNTALNGRSQVTYLAVANGFVYAAVVYSSPTHSVVVAYDAGGAGCSGVPMSCPQAFSADWGWDPVVDNGLLVYVGANGIVAASDATGVQNCSGSPTTCVPVATLAMPAAYSNGGYAVIDSTFYVMTFDSSNVLTLSAYR